MSYQSRTNARAGRCSEATCRAELLWAATPKGKRNPLDPRPTLEGNIRLELRPDRTLDLAHTLTALELEAARAAGEALYTSHFGTCPAREEFRRRGNKGKARR